MIYPQRGGQFEIPEIPLHISVMGEGSQSIIGEISSAGLSFTATVPEQMADKPGWVATTRYEVEEHFDKPLDQLKPGDALVRTVSISAVNLSAMMLPTLKNVDINGIAIYSAPAQLNDQTNRGEYSGVRTEQATYIFEKAGDFQLPPQTFYWWNLDTQSLEFITLASQELKITGGQGASGRVTLDRLTEGRGPLAALSPLLKNAGLILVVVILLWYVGDKLRKRLAYPMVVRSNEVSERALRKQFQTACSKQEFEDAMGLFYRWLDHYGGAKFKLTVRESLKLMDETELTIAFAESMESIYGVSKEKIDIQLFASRFFKQIKNTNRIARSDDFAIELKLN